jgi:hypothetical protein
MGKDSVKELEKVFYKNIHFKTINYHVHINKKIHY